MRAAGLFQSQERRHLGGRALHKAGASRDAGAPIAALPRNFGKAPVRLSLIRALVGYDEAEGERLAIGWVPLADILKGS